MRGVIAAGGAETAAAGAAMLEQGGNAVDAAVAAAFASFISEIGVVHWGGSGIAQIWDPHSGTSVVYDFFSTVPGLGAMASQPLDFQEVTIDFGATTQDFHLGRASVAVPGNIFGLCRLAADHGRLPLPVLLEPAYAMARDGVAIAPFQADTCRLLEPLYSHTEGMRRIFMTNGSMIAPGERLFIPDLAQTIEQLMQEGSQLLRRGALAQALLADQRENGGLLTQADLDTFAVNASEPIVLPYRAYEILLPPPSSSGGALIGFSLLLLSQYDVAAFTRGSATHLQLLYEVMAATNRARPALERFNNTLPPAAASAAFLDPAHVAPFAAAVDKALRARRPSPAPAEKPGPGNTSHLSVIDSEGMAVSLTTTAGESAGYVVPGTGFIPNNMLGEADLHPDGFHTRPAGQRIPTMMTPTIVRHNGAVRLVVGTGGSERIRSAIVQVLSNLLDFGLQLKPAVNRARVHLEGATLQCEAGYDEAAVAELASWGYPVNRWPTRSIYFGGAHSVSRTPRGRLVGAGDNRRGGAVATVVNGTRQS